MEIPMAEGKFKNREIKWLREIDWLELFYLVLFTAFVIKKYLGTTHWSGSYRYGMIML